MNRFPTAPCLVATAILAVLLAIGFAMPFAAEASCGVRSVIIIVPDPTPVPPGTGPGLKSDLEEYIIRSTEADIPLDSLPSVNFEKLGLWSTGGGGEDEAIVADDRGYDVWRPNNDGKAKVAGVLDTTLKPDGPYLDESTAFGCRLCVESVATQKMLAGVKYGVGGILSPKPPKANDESGDGPAPKTKAKIVMLGTWPESGGPIK